MDDLALLMISGRVERRLGVFDGALLVLCVDKPFYLVVDSIVDV